MLVACRLGQSEQRQKKQALQFPADLFTFTKEILNGKLHFLCSEVKCDIEPAIETVKGSFISSTIEYPYNLKARS